MAGRRFNKEKLYWLRKQRGWSQEEAAERCIGNGFQDFLRTYKRLENEERIPRKGTLEKLCRGFGLTSPDALMLNPGEQPDPVHVDFYRVKRGDIPDGRPAMRKAGECFLVAMDVDNTILRGFEFSWKEIWRYLGFNDETRRAAMRKHLNNRELSYAEWCVYCMEMYASRGLTRADFNVMTKDFRVVANFRQGIRVLKQHGGVVAVISGGVDTFLEAMIPDYNRLFDEVFINRLHFNSAGRLFDVTPTPYDFEGKADAMQLLQQRYAIPVSQSYFIGEGLNDKYVGDVVGTSIAWSPQDQELEHRFDVVVHGDNFMDIVRLILPECTA